MFKQWRILTAAALVAGTAALGGCTSQRDMATEESAANAWLINDYSNAAMANAIIAQHTLFPYHFVRDSADLNDLGRLDQQILVEHFRQNAGQLNIRRGDASQALYQLRVESVRQSMRAAGVPAHRMTVGDDMPGGDGMASEQVLQILTKPTNRAATAPSREAIIVR